MIALDASALLAFMFGEPGHETVAAIIDNSCISTVNLSEVIGRFSRDGHDGDSVLRHIESTPIEIVPFSKAAASIAGRLIPRTRSLGLSLGDRACLALALEKGVPAITADKIWLELATDVEIRVIR